MSIHVDSMSGKNLFESRSGDYFDNKESAEVWGWEAVYRGQRSHPGERENGLNCSVLLLVQSADRRLRQATVCGV